jgi:hypothetical protein
MDAERVSAEAGALVPPTSVGEAPLENKKVIIIDEGIYVKVLIL